MVDPSAPLDTDVAIETPEHIVFRHRVAGPARRLVAYLIDMVVCYGSFAGTHIRRSSQRYMIAFSSDSRESSFRLTSQ